MKDIVLMLIEGHWHWPIKVSFSRFVLKNQQVKPEKDFKYFGF